MPAPRWDAFVIRRLQTISIVPRRFDAHPPAVAAVYTAGLDESRASRRIDGNDPRAIDRADPMSRGNASWDSFV